MKLNKLWLGTGALAAAVGFATLAPQLHAQPRGSAAPGTPQAQQQPQNQPDQPQQATKIQTFSGQVVKARNGRYALLTDKQAGKGFYLDDQEKAKQFDGQNVKVTGQLDMATNTIKVSDIQPA